MSEFKCVEIKMLQDAKFHVIRIVDWHTGKGVYRALVKQKKMKGMDGEDVSYGKMGGWNREDMKFLVQHMDRIIAIFDNKEHELPPEPKNDKEELDLDEVSF